MSLADKIQNLRIIGMCKRDIAKRLGVSLGDVTRIVGLADESCQWELERRRHAAFFGGLSPQQEYDRHTRQRKELEADDAD